jgi:hypothetical protein
MKTPKTKPSRSLKRVVSCDRIGWDAIQHKDGWWVGTEKGVTCYGDHELARAALTIIWQREGGRQLNYRIKPFTGANVANGEHTPKLSAVDALKRYEAKAANRQPEQTGSKTSTAVFQ